MSDFSIPGTATDKYGTQTLIDGLMKVARIPRDETADKIKALQTQKSVWLDFNQRLGLLRAGAQGLYNFKNPFDARQAKSSDESVLTATATRQALEQSRTVLVKRVAASDRFISAELPKDYRVPSGDYVFTVGDKNVELKFGGGSLQDFADALTRKGGDLLRAQVVAVKTDTRSIVVESLKTGIANKLGLDGDAVRLGLDTALVERASSSRQELDPAKAVAWSAPLESASVAISGGTLALTAGGEARLELQRPIKSAGMVLEIEYRMTSLPQDQAPSPPPGPGLGVVGSATYEGITVTGAPSASGLPEWVPPPSPPRVEDLSMASAIGPDGGAKALPALSDGEGVQKLSVPLDAYGPSISALGFRVRDTTRRLEIVKARVYDPTETGGLKPVKPLSTAQDAVVSVDGIDVTRPENAIADLVPGVTLNLKSASDKPVTLKVQPDRDAVQAAIVAFVGTYNKLMAQVNILTRSDEKVIDEISYLTDDEKKAARANLGTLQGDSTLNLLANSLERLASSPYQTKDGADMSLLAQVGISTNASALGTGGGYDVSKMRGYLEIEDEAMAKALDQHFDAVKELFGRDANGDLIVDSGFAYSLDNLVKPYVETGGILSLKTGTIDTQLGQDKTQLDSLDAQLATKEQDLKEKYGEMEASLNRMESSSSSIDNFTKQNSGQ
jgi:flagellar hook-associated protein 2